MILRSNAVTVRMGSTNRSLSYGKIGELVYYQNAQYL
jgi:hypothetical protein